MLPFYQHYPSNMNSDFRHLNLEPPTCNPKIVCTLDCGLFYQGHCPFIFLMFSFDFFIAILGQLPAIPQLLPMS